MSRLRAGWDLVASLSDAPSAEAFASRLREQGVIAVVSSDAGLLGQGQPCDVHVPHEFAHRARWLLAADKISEAELAYLATGELDPEAASQDPHRP